MLMYKTPSLYIEQFENPSFNFVRQNCLSLNTLRGLEATLNPDFLTKSVDITLQTSPRMRTIEAQG